MFGIPVSLNARVNKPTDILPAYTLDSYHKSSFISLNYAIDLYKDNKARGWIMKWTVYRKWLLVSAESQEAQQYGGWVFQCFC